jgi:hypothetical protein
MYKRGVRAASTPQRRPFSGVGWGAGFDVGCGELALGTIQVPESRDRSNVYMPCAGSCLRGRWTKRAGADSQPAKARERLVFGYICPKRERFHNNTLPTRVLRYFAVKMARLLPTHKNSTANWLVLQHKAQDDDARAAQSARAAGCRCFSWCTSPEMGAFFAGLPALVMSRSEPWYRYAAHVVGGHGDSKASHELCVLAPAHG